MVASSENITIDDESLHVVAHKADGAMRDALTIFDQTVAFCGTDVKYQDVLRNLNVLDYEYSFSLVDAFLKGDYPTALTIFDEILTKGFNALHFVAALSSHLRDLVVSKSGGLEALLELPDSLKVRYKEQADRCPMQFLYEGLGITTACESGYRASVNPRLHIEFALMRLAFLMNKPAAQAPAQNAQPVQTVQTPVQPAQTAPVAPVTQSAPAAPATPVLPQPAATSPTPAPSQTETPAPADAQTRERRTRAARATSSLSMKAVMSDEKPQEVVVHKEAPAPTEDEIRAKWPELALRYKHLDRLSAMLNTTTLDISDEGDHKKVVFRVVNEAQKNWVEAKMLYDLEGNLRAILKSMKVYLRVEVTPDDAPRTAEPYMPSEKAGHLMKENEEVNKLVQDFGLDIK
jgi:DNA polymerase-3 subunit gamma/tau